MTIPEIKYFENTGRYKWTHGKKKNKFMSDIEVRDIFDQRLDKYKERVEQISQQLFDKKISIGAWSQRVGDLYKKAGTEAFMIGHPTELNASDKGIMGAFVRTQNRRFKEFLTKIRAGDLSEAQIVDRAKKYISKANEMREEGRRRHMQNVLYIWETRKLAVAEHCPSCLRYAARGWVPIGTLPRITEDCECQSNDKCYFKYSRKRTRPTSRTSSIGIMTLEGYKMTDIIKTKQKSKVLCHN